jgi:20S proteasome alpha/beta subunit
MTIAIGILVSDGIVLAADTEQTWGYLKTSRKKLRSIVEDGGMLIAGSGSSHHIESLSQRLERIFATNKKLDIDGLEAKFQEEMSLFFQNHILPFGGQVESPDLIIGIERRSKRCLWASQNGTLRRCDFYTAVGLGAEYAEHQMDALLGVWHEKRSPIGTTLAVRIAAFSVWATKEAVQNCGKHTHIASLSGATYTPYSRGTLSTLEARFESQKDLQAMGLQYMMGFPVTDEAAALNSLLHRFQIRRQDVLGTERFTTDDQFPSLE